ncbi:hypothetical protein QOT17_014003 [Balamuthia mandrillaris]
MTRSLCLLLCVVVFLSVGFSRGGEPWQPWQPAQQTDSPLKVAVLTDQEFVDYPYWVDPEYASPAFILPVVLGQRGHNVTLVSNLGEESVAEEVVDILSQAPVLVVPLDESPNEPPADLPELLREYLNQGGVVVWTGQLDLLNLTLSLGIKDIIHPQPHIDGVIVARQETEEVFEKTEEAQETPFAGGPAFVEDWTRDQLVNMTAGWPEEAVCSYASEDGEACAVFSLPVGEGQLVFLGWDFYGREGGDVPIPLKRDFLTDEWREVFLLAVEGFLTEPTTSSAGSQGSSEDGNSESSESSESFAQSENGREL